LGKGATGLAMVGAGSAKATSVGEETVGTD
jgi:hypothetical protein